MALKDNLRRLREKVSPSAKAFAEQIGIKYTKYNSYENGVWPSQSNLMKIAAALQVSLDDLLGYSLDEYTQAIYYIETHGGTVSAEGDKIVISIPSDRENQSCVAVYDTKEDFMKTIQDAMQAFNADTDAIKWLTIYAYLLKEMWLQTVEQ